MNDKELNRQKFQAQLDEWKADIDKLKEKAAGAKADAQLDMNKLVADLEAKVKIASDKLAGLAEASDEAWDSAKKSVESSWDSLKSSIHHAVAKLKD